MYIMMIEPWVYNLIWRQPQKYGTMQAKNLNDKHALNCWVWYFIYNRHGGKYITEHSLDIK
jgi:hypothetical protein